MRIDIKTKGIVKDPDIRVLYLLNKALEISTDRMAKANLEMIISKWHKKIHKKINP